jgi:CubicO group peptidase (beta-lactamase class C family)
MKFFRVLSAVLLGVSLAPLSRSADPSATGLPHGTPEEEGISSQSLLGFVGDAETKLNALHSFVLVRHGKIVAEGWWDPYAADQQHILFSLSKSFTSTAVGLAISEGKLSIYDPVLKFFPDEAPAFPSHNLQIMRVRDLLRMATGQRDEDLRTFPFASNLNLVKVFLELPVPDKPGTHFVYNTAATYMLSAIVQKVTGQTVLDYLRPRLFEPLGITDPKWDASAQGISYGGFGLNLRTEEIARFGQLYLQKGNWNGKQLIPADWVEAATTLQIANGGSADSDWDQGYCYQFWRCTHGFYRGDGAFGQYCIVMPQYDAVMVMTAATRDLQSVLNLVWADIVPAFKDQPLPADADSDGKLAAKLSSLVLKTQDGQASSPMAARVSGKRYTFDSNHQNIESVELDAARGSSAPSITLRVAGADQHFSCGMGSWARGSVPSDAGPVPVAANGAWSSEDTYSFMLCRNLTTFTTSYDLRFAGDQVILESEDNVGLEGTPRNRIVGRLQP